MQKIFLVLSGFLLFACKSTTNALRPERIFTNQAANTSFVSTSPESVAAALNFLASDSLMGREIGGEGIAKAAAYLEAYFKTYNILPYFSTYRDSLENARETAYNVVGFVEGSDAMLRKEFLIIGAHYDHIGVIDPVDGDAIANGANDNATGVTAVLEIAKYFAQTRSNKRSLLVVLFSAEEEGLLGSEHLAQKLKTMPFNPYAMVNFEMIGVPVNRSYKAYLTGYNQSNMAAKINEYAGKSLIGYLPEEQEYQLFKRSDNYPFYGAFQIPAHTISTFDFTNYNYYHHVDDGADKMDAAHIASLVNDLLPALEKIANAPMREITLQK